MIPTQRRPTDDELLDAAHDVFASKGFRDTSVAAIAKHGKTTKPTLYSHLGPKETMYRSVVSRAITLMQARIFSVYDTLDTADVESAVRNAISAGMQYAADHPKSFRLLMSASASRSPAADLINEVYREFTVRIAQLIDGGLAVRGDAGPTTGPTATTRTVAAMVVSTGVEAARYALLVEEMDPIEATDVVTKFIFAGIEAVYDIADS